MGKFEEAEAVHFEAAQQLSEHRKTVGIHYLWTLYQEHEYPLEKFQAWVLETMVPLVDAELEVMATQVVIMNEHRHLRLKEVSVPITEAEFEAKVGRPPLQDDLERVNCTNPEAGQRGHRQCGWCETHNLPYFECWCQYEEA